MSGSLVNRHTATVRIPAVAYKAFNLSPGEGKALTEDHVDLLLMSPVRGLIEMGVLDLVVHKVSVAEPSPDEYLEELNTELALEVTRLGKEAQDLRVELAALKETPQDTVNAIMHPGNLAGSTIAEAAPLIEEETDLVKLAVWADDDERKGIRELCAARFEDIVKGD